MGDTHLAQTKDIFQYSFADHFASSKKETKDLVSPTNHLNQKDHHQKAILMDMLNVNNQNKELKLGMQQIEAKLQSKENEIIRLKYQLGMRDSVEDSLRPGKSPVITQRCSSRSPASGEYSENKISKHFKVNEGKKEKTFEEENRALHEEVGKLQKKLKELEEEKKTLKRELNKSKSQYNRLSVIQDERDELMKTNKSLKLQLEKLSGEISMISDEKLDIKQRYEDLKNCTLEILTSNKFSDYSITSTPHSDTFKSLKDTPISNFLFGTNTKSRGEDSLSSIRANSDLNLAECQKILAEIMDIYKIKNPTQIISSIHKTEKVIQAIPRLRKLISDISAIVLPNVKGDKESEDHIDLIIPSLKKCFKDLEELEALKGMRKKLVDMLNLEKECTNFDILKKVDTLVLVNYQYNDLKNQRGTRDNGDRVLFENFTRIFGVKPDMANLKQIHAQLEDLKYFTNLLKQKLGLNFSPKNENCLKYVLRNLETNIKDREAADIALKLQKTLNCKLETVHTKVEELIAERYKYNPFGFEGRL